MDCISEFIIQLLSKKLNIWLHFQFNNYIFYHTTSTHSNNTLHHQSSARSYKEDIPVKILHLSGHFLAVDKPYDVLINSDDPSNKVSNKNILKRNK